MGSTLSQNNTPPAQIPLPTLLRARELICNFPSKCHTIDQETLADSIKHTYAVVTQWTGDAHPDVHNIRYRMDQILGHYYATKPSTFVVDTNLTKRDLYSQVRLYRDMLNSIISSLTSTAGPVSCMKPRGAPS